MASLNPLIDLLFDVTIRRDVLATELVVWLPFVSYDDWTHGELYK